MATIFLFPTSIALYAIAMLVAEKSFRQHRNKTIVGVGLTVILITVVSDYFILRDLQLHLNIIIIILFICFVITGALVAKRLIGRLGSLPPEHAKRLEYVAFASTFGILFTVLFFLALVSYAYGIFPMIPSAKGGADYTDTPRTSVSFSDESGEFKWTGRMIQVYATSTAIYLAKPRLGNDACDWRSRNALPDILEIMRRA